MADRLLLLQSGGETVYFGDIGEDSRVIRDYFARNGAVCPRTVNPAEFMLEAIGAGITPRVGPRDWKDIWLESPERVRIKEDIRAMKSAAQSRPSETNKELTTTCEWRYAWASPGTQVRPRCDTLRVSSQGRRQPKSHCLVAIARLRLDSPIRSRFHLSFRFLVSPATGALNSRYECV